jgi:hypothetical protein
MKLSSIGFVARVSEATPGKAPHIAALMQATMLRFGISNRFNEKSSRFRGADSLARSHSLIDADDIS